MQGRVISAPYKQKRAKANLESTKTVQSYHTRAYKRALIQPINPSNSSIKQHDMTRQMMTKTSEDMTMTMR